MKAILLGSRRGVQRQDSSKSYPLALHEAGERRVLDHLLEAVGAVGADPVVYVGGYHIEKVVSAYPDLRFVYHGAWETEGEAGALRAAADELEGDVLLCRTDLLLDAASLAPLLAADAPVAVGVQQVDGTRALVPGNLPPALCRDGALLRAGEHLQRATEARYLLGVVRIRAEVLPRVLEEAGREGAASGSLAALLTRLVEGGQPVAAVDLPGEIRAVDPEGVHRTLDFGTKAETLERLRGAIQGARVPDLVVFTAADWKADPAAARARVTEALGPGEMAVRSSALVEDSFQSSCAGQFESVLRVPAGDPARFGEAVETVLESFRAAGVESPGNQVFVQPMVEEVAVSGVFFTRDLETRAPYLVVNYDSTTASTDSVTSGRGADLKTTVLYRHGVEPAPSVNARKIAAAASEIERLLDHDALDIEFVIDRRETLWILQVRPIATPRSPATPTDEDFAEELGHLRAFVGHLAGPHPTLAGASTILATMPDWNPAEMIGTCPRPLALSLYQYLISDRVWGDARTCLGYRDTYPQPLIVGLSGRPYVDVRASFNSFLPASLPEEAAAKLVDAQLARLRARPELHDKVEFDVATTCFTPDLPGRADEFREAGLDEEEVEAFLGGLRRLTADMVAGRVCPIPEQLALQERMAARRARLVPGEGAGVGELAGALGALLDDCQRLGTLPFSVLARYAFVAKILLRSLEALGVLDAAAHAEILGNLPTVATHISRDLDALAAGSLGRDEFLARYGHLRPGTYDLLSPSYREDPELYFHEGGEAAGGAHETDEEALARAAAVLDARAEAIDAVFRDADLDCTAAQFRDFVLGAVPAREFAKFEFSKNLSAALDVIGRIAGALGLARDDLTYVPIERLLRLRTEGASPSLRLELVQLSRLNRKRHTLTRCVQLPHMVAGTADLECFRLLEWEPNFITGKTVVAPVIDLDRTGASEDLDGKIVAIRSADPGYDWIFGHKIAGLVTEFGGVASHMAIRAAEFGLPAAIGCGSVIFGRAAGAKRIELDCQNSRIRVVQ